MGISIDAFIREFKVAAKQKDSAMELFIKKHITTQYVPFLTKVVYCRNIIDKTCYITDGKRKIIKINSENRYLFTIMRLIELYTDIEFGNYENADENNNISVDYDKLNEVGAIDKILNAIPENEFREFNNIMDMKLDDFRDNEYSLTSLLYNLKESLSLSEEVVNSVLDDLTKQAKQEK